MKKAATIEDIARKTGVSKSTVSRALGGSTRISASTRRKIAAVAGKLHYEPNYLARSLSRSKTLTIGVVLEDIMNPFFTEVAKGIETALSTGGYSMLLTSSGYVPETELELPDAAPQQGRRRAHHPRGHGLHFHQAPAGAQGSLLRHE